MSDENTLELWVARQLDGDLDVFSEEPTWDDQFEYWRADDFLTPTQVTAPIGILWPQLGVENSPVKVTINWNEIAK